jgi:hypothetical protein
VAKSLHGSVIYVSPGQSEGAVPCRKLHGDRAQRRRIPWRNRRHLGMRGPYHDRASASHCNPRDRYPENQAVFPRVTAPCGQPACCQAIHPRIPRTIFPWTSVRRKSRPWNR